MLPKDIDEEGNLIYEDGIQPIVIRTTERSNFRKCRRLYKYTSQNQLNLEPVRQSMNLVFGIAVHVGLETWYEPDTWNLHEDGWHDYMVEKSISSFQENLLDARKGEGNIPIEREKEYEEHLVLGTEMLRNYFPWSKKQDEELGLKPKAVEIKFQVPIYKPGTYEPLVIDGRPVVYQVRIDLLAEHGDGTIWIWDHKTAANIGGDHSFLDLDTQIASYAWAYLVKYGKVCSGVMYNELAKTYPRPPKVLAKGGLSQDKRQNTTYDMYVEKLAELGLDSAPYSAMLDYLATKEQNYFLRTPIVKSPREIAVVGEYVCQEIEDMTRPPHFYPNPGKMTCNGCAFQTPCNVENEGGDVGFVLSDSSLFRSRTNGELADGIH